MRRRQRPVEAVSGLPLELLAGPDPARWTPSPLPIDTYSDSHEQRVRSAAYHAWMAAGRAWEAKADLPHGQRWTELLPPELAYVAKSLGRAHVIAGGLGPPQGPGKVGSRSV